MQEGTSYGKVVVRPEVDEITTSLWVVKENIEFGGRSKLETSGLCHHIGSFFTEYNYVRFKIKGFTFPHTTGVSGSDS